MLSAFGSRRRGALLLRFLLAAAAPSACCAIFFENPILLPNIECFIKFFFLNFDPNNFDQYDTYFQNDTIMELAQTGQYSGPDGIKEYVRFTNADYSPYLATGPIDRQDTISFEGYENGQCIFLAIYHTVSSLDPTYAASNVAFRWEFMLKIFFDYGDNYISRINVFFSDPFVTTFFTNFLDTDQTRQFVCDTRTGPSCSGILEEDNDTVNATSCREQLQALPLLDDGAHADGKSQACRALHAVFAAVNPEHCPHISFAPQIDVHGKIKCQTVGNIQPEDLFTPEEITKFFDIGQAVGIDPATGIKIVVELPTSTKPCGLLGLGILCFNGCGFFGRLFGLCATTSS